MTRILQVLLALASAASLWVPIPIPGISAPDSGSDGGGSSLLLVRLEHNVPESLVQPALASLGGSVERSLLPIRVLVVRVPDARLESALAVLRLHPMVEEAQQEIDLAAVDTNPNDVHWPGQWGLQQARFTKAWDVARGSESTVVGVVDTGVERSHPDLQSVALRGYDFVDEDSDPTDEHGHGTAVAGILAARANNRTGIAGACWTCRVLPVRVLRRNGTGSSGTIAAGIVWAVDHGATVINLSLGGERSSLAIEGAVDYALDHDVVVVAAAGNNGSTRRFYPAATPRVVAVAGSDRANRLYSWSNRGDWVDITAPGCNTSPWRGGAYATLCGTSSAAPLVAGLVALIRSANPRANAKTVVSSLRGNRLDAALAFPKPNPVRRATPRPTRRQELSAVVRRSLRRR